jgi:hypothetical protein
MNLDQVEKIADGVLYEGYMLYPYRPSSLKNRQRWNFGALCPPSYCKQQHGAERDTMQTEVLVQTMPGAKLIVKVRFLQIIGRFVRQLRIPLKSIVPIGDAVMEPVQRLEVDGKVYQSWQEAVEREIVCSDLRLDGSFVPISLPFEYHSHDETELLQNERGELVGAIVRDWQHLSGTVELTASDLGFDICKLRVVIRNKSQFVAKSDGQRQDAILSSLVSTHTILGVENGEFVSLLEPPVELERSATECENIGTWPVLAGEQGSREAILSSPIILYDYPQIAPESAGSLFDGTEIDEILSLRIMTLTEDEKREIRQSDDRAREMLDRTESLPAEQFMRLHGALRALQPAREEMR